MASAFDILGGAEAHMRAAMSPVGYRSASPMWHKPTATSGLGGGERFIGIELHMGKLAASTFNLGLALGTEGLELLAARKGDWQMMIREHTPRGPERNADENSKESVHAAMRHTSKIRPSGAAWDTWSAGVWKSEGIGYVKLLKANAIRQRKHGTSLSNVDFKGTDETYIAVADALLRKKYGKRYITEPPEPVVEHAGSLWQSIQVTVGRAPEGGQIKLAAYSDNHYAWFIEHGFDHGLMPVLRWQRRKGGGSSGSEAGDKAVAETGASNIAGGSVSGEFYNIVAPRYEKYTSLTIGHLGEYTGKFPGGGAAWAGSVDDRGSSRWGFPWTSTFQIDPEGKTSSRVTFTTRDDKPKHQAGAHMFEKGTDAFLHTMRNGWAKDVDRLARASFDQVFVTGGGFTRVRAGTKGFNRPGTFAKKYNG